MLYALPTTGPINWSSNQRKSIAGHPNVLVSGVFQTASAPTLADQVRQRYLQFLWLPDAIVPLVQLVPLLLLLLPKASAEESSRALHAALDEVLLTERLSAHKYRHLIPKWVDETATVTADDLEAEMARFAFNHYPVDEVESYDATQDLDEEASTLRWIKEMEKREVQLQILLHLLKLSLPGPTPALLQKSLPLPSPDPSQSANTTRHDRLLMPHLSLKSRTTMNGKRTRPRPSPSSESEEQTPRQILEDRLENLMDRLAVWQMALPVDEEMAQSASKVQREEQIKEVRDWTQAFCEDVVRVHFAEKLPESYNLLRSKLFRLPQWSSEGEDTEADEPTSSKAKSLSRSQSQSREDSNFFGNSSAPSSSAPPHLSHSNSLARSDSLSRTDSFSRTISLSRTNSNSLSRTSSLARTKSTSKTSTQNLNATATASSSSTSRHDSRSLSRSRSRSLSLSLTAEAEAQAKAQAASNARKRPLQREISMSKAFRPKSVDPIEHVSKRIKREQDNPPSLAERQKGSKAGVVLVEATPTKSVRQGRDFGGSSAGVGGRKADGILVQDSPVKGGRGRGGGSGGSRRQSQMLVEEDDDDDTDEE